VATDEDRVLAALADPSRRRVLELLAERPSPVGELASRLPITRPAVSQHLRVLADAGLVQSTAAGTRRIYSVRPEALAMLREWLDLMWRDALAAFAAAVDEEGGARRRTGREQQ
jgi:DNA-binding transcriptional ArsR family regulator